MIWAISGFTFLASKPGTRRKSEAREEGHSAVEWENGWDGIASSPADRIKRKNVSAAAAQVCDGLLKQLSQWE